MPLEELLAAIERYILENNTCALVTGSGSQIRNTQIEMLKKLPEVMNPIKTVPERIDFLNSDFKKDGYGSRQEYICF